MAYEKRDNSEIISAHARRDVAMAEKNAEILRLRIKGLTFQQIADEVGFRSASGVYQRYKATLKATIQEPADELRRLERERLDSLLAAIWPLAMAGKGYAVEKALMIMDRKARMLGLDAPTRSQVTVSDEMTSQIEQLAAELGVVVPAE